MNLSELAKVPMREEAEMGMVEIIMLKWRCPDIEVRCAERIIRYTEWPYKLVVYDNRLNTPNTSRIWNKLIRQSTCEVVCILDSDVFVQDTLPCWLSRMMRTFAAHPDCKLVVPVTDRCANPPQRLTAAEPYETIIKSDSVWSGFCFLTRKTLLDEVGPFDEDFVGYGQDSEFAVRLERAGGGCYIRRDVWVEHLHGASFSEATKSGVHDATADREYAQRLYLEKTGQ